jgi:hypothetical protein
VRTEYESAFVFSWVVYRVDSAADGISCEVETRLPADKESLSFWTSETWTLIEKCAKGATAESARQPNGTVPCTAAIPNWDAGTSKVE